MKCQTIFSWEIYKKIQLSVKFAKRLLKLNIQGKVKKNQPNLFLVEIDLFFFDVIALYEGKSISNQPIPFPIDRDTQNFHALFQYMF